MPRDHRRRRPDPFEVLKRQLQKVSGASRFQQRLLRESGQLLCDETRLEAAFLLSVA